MHDLLEVALVPVLAAAAAIDLRRGIIPNALTAGAAAAGLALLALTDRAALPGHLAAAAAAGSFFLLAALGHPGAMGMGDVKLVAVLGLYLGAAVVVALLVALLTATAVGVAARRTTIPLGPFLALGGVVGLFA